MIPYLYVQAPLKRSSYWVIDTLPADGRLFYIMCISPQGALLGKKQGSVMSEDQLLKNKAFIVIICLVPTAAKLQEYNECHYHVHLLCMKSTICSALFLSSSCGYLYRGKDLLTHWQIIATSITTKRTAHGYASYRSTDSVTVPVVSTDGVNVEREVRYPDFMSHRVSG